MKLGPVAFLVGLLVTCCALCGCDCDAASSVTTTQPPVPGAILAEIGDVPTGDSCYVSGVLSPRLSPAGELDEHGSTFDLLGVDAPALDEPGGPEARAFLHGLLTKRKVWVDQTGTNKSDPRHGFVNLYLSPGGDLVSAELVRHGYARVTDLALPEHAELLRGLEAEAQRLKLGVWK